MYRNIINLLQNKNCALRWSITKIRLYKVLYIEVNYLRFRLYLLLLHNTIKSYHIQRRIHCSKNGRAFASSSVGFKCVVARERSIGCRLSISNRRLLDKPTTGYFEIEHTDHCLTPSVPPIQNMYLVLNTANDSIYLDHNIVWKAKN